MDILKKKIGNLDQKWKILTVIKIVWPVTKAVAYSQFLMDMEVDMSLNTVQKLSQLN